MLPLLESTLLSREIGDGLDEGPNVSTKTKKLINRRNQPDDLTLMDFLKPGLLA